MPSPGASGEPAPDIRDQGVYRTWVRCEDWGPARCARRTQAYQVNSRCGVKRWVWIRV